MSSSSQMKVSVPVASDDGQNYTFTLADGADCFCFYYYLPSQAPVTMSLYNENEQDFFPQIQYKDLYREGLFSEDGQPFGLVQSPNGSISFSLPIATGETVDLSSPWTVGVSNTSGLTLQVCQRIIESGQISEYTLKVNTVLYCSDKMKKRKVTWIREAQKRIKEIFQQVPITCEFGNVTVCPLPDKPVTIDFNNPVTAQIVQESAKPDALTIIFVEGLVTDIGLEKQLAKAVGRSGGIPGPQGFVNQYAATLIKFSNKEDDPLIVNEGMLGNAVAHEMAHYLGLTHESGKSEDGSDELSNLMSPYGGLAKQELNAKQKYILTHMPLVQVTYADRELLSEGTPVTQLEIELTTGTRNYPGGTNDNTSLVVNFSLGSDEEGYQTWVLDSDSTANYLQPGSTTVFQLQEIGDLYMEDLDSWKIYCDWDRNVLYPMNFRTVTNYWDLAQIKITANGIVIEDAAINTVLSWVAQTNMQKNIKTN